MKLNRDCSRIVYQYLSEFQELEARKIYILTVLGRIHDCMVSQIERTTNTIEMLRNWTDTPTADQMRHWYITNGMTISAFDFYNSRDKIIGLQCSSLQTVRNLITNIDDFCPTLYELYNITDRCRFHMSEFQ